MDTDGPASYTYAVPMDAGPGAYSEILTVTDAVGNELTVPVNIEAPPLWTISPGRLHLPGVPGADVMGLLTFSGGTPPYHIRRSDCPSEKISTNQATFTYHIPSTAEPGVSKETIWVTDKNGFTNEVEVHIIVMSSALSATPATLDLKGTPGELIRLDFNISGGQPAYTINDPPGLGSVNEAGLDTDGPASYTYAVPMDAGPG
ncbi:MAG: hypothetical protein GY859_08030, partial [Desulfobacterales bacterium]|nr:hypothetical protein [Desulfobacterales bacterium]